VLSYSEACKTFSHLLDWHLSNGTRPPGKGNGKAWSNNEFARTLQARTSPKAVFLWRTGRHIPRAIDFIKLALFGDAPTDQLAIWDTDFQSAYSYALTNKAKSHPLTGNFDARLNQLLVKQTRLSSVKEIMMRDAAMFRVCMEAVGTHVDNIKNGKTNSQNVDPVKTFFEGVYHMMHLFDILLENSDIFSKEILDNVSDVRSRVANAITEDNDPDTARDILREAVFLIGDAVDNTFKENAAALTNATSVVNRPAALQNP
jgi:hypothetical protein